MTTGINQFHIETFPGRGTSRTYLLRSGNQKILIDPGWPSAVLPILNLHPDISLVVLTHRHFDHHGAAMLVRNITGAPIAAAADSFAEEKLIELPRIRPGFLLHVFRSWIKSPYLPKLVDLRHMSVKRPSADKELRNNNYLDEKEQWRIILTPGHTADSLCIYHPTKKIIFTGDLVVNPFGKPKWGQIVADQWQYRRSQAVLSRLNINRIYPGHGDSFTVTGKLSTFLA